MAKSGSSNSRRSRGIFGKVFGVIWFIFVSALVIAFIEINDINDVGKALQYARIKSQELNACITKSTETESIQCNLSLRVGAGPNSGDAIKPKVEDPVDTEDSNTPELIKILGLENVGKKENAPNPEKRDTGGVSSFDPIYLPRKEYISKIEDISIIFNYPEIDYDRTQWKHWEPYDKSHKCWNIREEVLYRQATPETVVLLDKDKKITTEKSLACSIQSGHWIDPWTKEEFTKPGELDVDHHVPLMVTAKSGGQNWDKELKKKYANDLDVLVAVGSKQNRSKGVQTPSEWMPKDKSVHCDYSKIYVNIVSKYNLAISEDDKAVLQKAIKLCDF